MDEFGLISRHFAPLANGFPGSLNLTDDAAALTPPAGCELVITTDALIAGVHFLGSESPALIAQKALRINISDLAAMGASPLCYFLALMLPRSTNDNWLTGFAEGLKRDQQEFGISLAGGDTTAMPGPLSISITALGTVPAGSALKRSGAKVGDGIYVSGALGDSALGLSSLRAKRSNPESWIATSATPPRDDNYLEHRYLLPQPRLALGQELRSIASSAMDISDGLVQDLGHICAASHVGATIHQAALPLSDAARAHGDAAFMAALTGGDDYELLFTVPPEKAHLLPEGCTRIGEIVVENDVKILDASKNPIVLNYKGYKHF